MRDKIAPLVSAVGAFVDLSEERLDELATGRAPTMVFALAMCWDLGSRKPGTEQGWAR